MTSRQEDEDGLAQQLMNACDERGEEIDPVESAEIIHKLGLVYRQKSEPTVKIQKLLLIKSAGLLNAAIVRNPSNVSEIKKDLYNLCKHILQQAEAADQSADLIEKAEHVKASFIKLRNEVDQFLLDIKYSDKENPTKNAQDENMSNFDHAKTKTIRSIQTKITDTYKEIMADLCEYCEKVMGKLSCKYTLIGMGSLARGEITPYSDFEHMITLEEKGHYKWYLDHFRWLSVIFHVVVLNLQETIIPALNIESLNDAEGNCWFFDSHTRGISFDGMMPHASKYPLGRQPTENKKFTAELIKPVSKMLKYLSSEEDLKNGYHLKDLLTKTCFVYGNRELFNEFVNGVENRLKSKTSEETCDEIISQVRDDLNKFSIRQTLPGISKSDKINIKQLVYRSSTLFIAALGRFHSISASSSFDAINEMAEQNKITQYAKHKLLFAAAIACEMRLKVYMEHKSQHDSIEIKAHEGGIKKFLNVVGQKSTVHYFQIVYCLQSEVAKLLKLTKLHFYTDPQLININICRALSMNAVSKNESTTTSWGIADFSFDDCLNEIEKHFNSQQNPTHIGSSKNELQQLKTLADQKYDQEIFDEALELYRYFHDLYEQQQQTPPNESNKASKKKDHWLDDLVDLLKVDQNSTSNQRDYDVAKICEIVEACLAKMDQCKESLNYFLISLKIYQKESLNEERDPRIAKTLNNIGACLRSSHQYTESLLCLRKSITIYEKISWVKEGNPDVANALENIEFCLQDRIAHSFEFLQKFRALSKMHPQMQQEHTLGL